MFNLLCSNYLLGKNGIEPSYMNQESSYINILLKLIDLLKMCVSVCMYATCVQVPQEAQGAHEVPWASCISGGCEPT